MTDYPQGDAFLTLLLAAMDDAVLEGKLIQFQTQFIPQGSKKYEVIRIIVVPEKMKHTWPTYAPAGTPVKGNHSPDYQTSVKELQYFQQPAGQLIQLDRSQQLWKEGVSGTHLVVYDPLTGETKDILNDPNKSPAIDWTKFVAALKLCPQLSVAWAAYKRLEAKKSVNHKIQ
jgi:hypothetical protein